MPEFKKLNLRQSIETEDVLLKTKDSPNEQKIANIHPNKCTHKPTHPHTDI